MKHPFFFTYTGLWTLFSGNNTFPDTGVYLQYGNSSGSPGAPGDTGAPGPRGIEGDPGQCQLLNNV